METLPRNRRNRPSHPVSGVRFSLKRQYVCRGVFPAMLILCLVSSHAGAWPDRLEGHGGPVRGIAVSAERSELLSASIAFPALPATY